MNKDDALSALQKYCIRQDRCHAEVRNKLLKLKVYGQDLEEIMADLITDGYLDEERYARSYVRGKHKMNRWGRVKIRQGLKLKKVSEYCIKKGFEELNDSEYQETLATVLFKKLGYKVPLELSYAEKQKLISFAINKGYEYEVIKMVLQDMEAGHYKNHG